MILPEDIEKQQFEVSFRGYSTREVDEFLNTLHTELEELLTEQEALKRKIAAAELIAKDAKDHEEEFVASIQEDKDKSEALLAAAKAEGERIIREAKNAASGIMAEVRRRAGDISTESRKASTDILESARGEAEEIVAAAKTEADSITNAAKATAEKKLYSAQTAADNILKAARVEAKSVKDEADSAAAEVTKKAQESAAVHEEYIKEVRAAAEKLCFEIDTELKNSAARIALLGKRISSADLPEKSEDGSAEKSAPAVTENSKNTDGDTPVPAHAVTSSEKKADTATDDGNSAGGYFTQEYKLAMAELFGDDANTDIPNASMEEDDDTYDYFDHAQIINGENDDDDDEDEDEDDDTYGDGDEDGDGDTVTSEYSGFPTSGKSGNILDIFSDDALDRVYGTPSQNDIDDILSDD